jgi:hypothetical protein
MDHIEVLIAAAAVVISPIVAWITIRMTRPKLRAEASEVLTDVSLSLIEPLRARIAELENRDVEKGCRIDSLERENRVLHRWAQVLFSQVVESGNTPISFEEIRRLNGNDTQPGNNG